MSEQSGKATIRLVVEIETELKEALRRLAIKNDRTMTAEIKRILRRATEISDRAPESLLDGGKRP